MQTGTFYSITIPPGVFDCAVVTRILSHWDHALTFLLNGILLVSVNVGQIRSSGNQNLDDRFSTSENRNSHCLLVCIFQGLDHPEDNI